VTACDAYPLQISQCPVAIRKEFLRLNAERAEEFGQFVGSIRCLISAARRTSLLR